VDTEGQAVTEAEWRTNTDPRPLIRHLGERVDGRKGRLFVAACGRRVAALCGHGLLDVPIRVAEKVADGAATDGERADAWAAIADLNRQSAPLDDLARWACLALGWAVGGGPRPAHWDSLWDFLPPAANVSGPPGVPTPAAALRCLFGNPFRRVTFESRCRTEDAIGVARGIYEDRAFDRLPLLADALMDAGCDDDQVLDHCRLPGPHTRGCWVVDLVLGKE
jgi:hypothetical protein